LFLTFSTFPDLRGRHIFRPNLEGPSTATARKHDLRIPTARSRLAETHVAAGLVFQKRQIRHIPNDDHSKSLPMVVQGQDDPLYGEADPQVVLCHELFDLSTRHPGV
jgi:hypothetical protein